MELLTWLIYNCGLALFPILLVRIGLWLTNASIPLAKLLKDGQLFFYAATLTATAMGDLTKAPPQTASATGGFEWWFVGLLGLTLLTTFLFGVTAAATTTNDRRIARTSYACALLATALVAALRWDLHLYC